MVTNAQLKMDWTYSELVHNEQTIEELAYLYMQALREIIDQSQTLASRAVTTSDFPLAALNEETLGRLSNLLNTLQDKG
jgi:non-ribosomal peptide synthase protein (TIGR01720 family)